MAFGNRLDDEQEVMSEINMTPLVDVMLVLLIIFIVAMPLLSHTVKIDLPQVTNQPNKIKPDSITISVRDDGEIFWNKQRISNEELQQYLQAAAQRQPQPDVQLRGDREVDYGEVVKVMAAAQRAGITRLGFVTLPND